MTSPEQWDAGLARVLGWIFRLITTVNEHRALVPASAHDANPVTSCGTGKSLSPPTCLFTVPVAAEKPSWWKGCDIVAHTFCREDASPRKRFKFIRVIEVLLDQTVGRL